MNQSNSSGHKAARAMLVRWYVGEAKGSSIALLLEIQLCVSSIENKTND